MHAMKPHHCCCHMKK
ncbi:unnamed protein product [Spirodela intermedia]|uniref:Uncharacterized protein n=1 Tax=Spirodela intermedia TaxID=51605 RepID=A0A7I8J775_SPIIN|nr:unnamed protein product [Spirodela intermedia]CAA2634850.1 unnamed protein product [Spirodela intermedia]CAA6665272.1 unnamed protein product [Spirodela intermedia]CAA6673823.1 unnamed protein product [Spirodela intermedia]